MARTRKPRYTVQVIKTGEVYVATNDRDEAVKTAKSMNRKANDHLGVVYRNHYLRIV